MALDYRNRWQRHKKKKREIEIDLIIKHLRYVISKDDLFSSKKLKILEIGSGDGYQINHLQSLGDTVASDINLKNEIQKRIKFLRFVKCDASALPFLAGTFDLIFSNHVLEHIYDIENTFLELKRVGKGHCLYAMVLPTHFWLLLSLPAQYYNKFFGLKNFSFKSRPRHCNEAEIENGSDDPRKYGSSKKSFLDKILPHGHGTARNFQACFSAFRIKSWEALFKRYYFTIREMHPLLLFAPSSLPIVPMTQRLNRFNISSSVLFLIQKRFEI